MAIKSISILGVFVFVVVAATLSDYSSAAVGGRRALSGDVLSDKVDFVAVDPKDPNVVKIARFTVGEYKKDQLNLERVVDATYEKDSQGSIYALVIEAKGEGGVGTYNAQVRVGGNTKKVITFLQRI